MNLTDQINNINPTEAGQATFAIASGLQDHPPARQVMATAMFLLVQADAYGLCLVDTLAKARNVLLDTDQFNQRQIAAIYQLIREEYLK